MWTNAALARAIRQQGIAQRRRSFTFTPAPMPRPAQQAHLSVDEEPRRQPDVVRTESVLQD